jgi:hypothetical protein
MPKTHIEPEAKGPRVLHKARVRQMCGDQGGKPEAARRMYTEASRFIGVD